MPARRFQCGGDVASEANIQARVRLEAARKGVRLFRNNSGAGVLENGSFVRFGLGNDSEAVNRVMKSSDLIGWRSVTITEGMVGQRVAVFVARECKPTDWKESRTDERTVAQRRFIDMVNAGGGDGAFCTTDDTLTPASP